MIDSQFGKMPRTLVRRRISRFNRSVGLFDQTFVQTGFGAWVYANTSSSDSSKYAETCGNFGFKRSTTSRAWTQVEVKSRQVDTTQRIGSQKNITVEVVDEAERAVDMATG